MVRVSGQVNSARTGTPQVRESRKVTSTTRRLESEASSSTTRCENAYGWNHAPCHGSSRLAITSSGWQVPGSTITALTEPSSGGRADTAGRSVNVSPSVARRTQISSPSSRAAYGLQVRSPFDGQGEAVPAAVHGPVQHRAGVHQRPEVRAGAGAGDQGVVGVAPEHHLPAGDRPGHGLRRPDVAALPGDEPAAGVLRLGHRQGSGDPTRLGLPPGRGHPVLPGLRHPLDRDPRPDVLGQPSHQTCLVRQVVPETQRHGCPLWRGRADLRRIEPGQAALRIRGPVTMIRPAVSALRAVGTRARPLNTL